MDQAPKLSTSGCKYSLSFTCSKLVHKVFEKYSEMFMTMPKQLYIRVSAQCTFNVKYLHLYKLMSETYTNKTAHTIVENLFVITQDIRVKKKHQQSVFIFRHDAFNMAEVYCVELWSKVTNEGSGECVFLPIA